MLVDMHGYWVDTDSPGGQVFWVGPTSPVPFKGKAASDGNSGLEPRFALATIQAALNKCVASRGDVVVCLPGTYTITAALTMTTAGVTLRGLPTPVHAKSKSVIDTVGVTEMIAIDAANCIVKDLTLDHNPAAAAAITLIDIADTTAAPGVRIENVFFDMEGSETQSDCIRIGDGTQAAINCLVKDCVLHDIDQAGITVSTTSTGAKIINTQIYDLVTANAGTNGIVIDTTGRVLVKDCFVSCNGTAAISVSRAAAKADIHNNIIHATGANTIGILYANTATGWSMGNYISAVAAGNLVDFTTAATTSSSSNDQGQIYAADPATAALTTATIDGS